MKFKIKVYVMEDGHSRFLPMVKKHWWTPWKDISARVFYTADDAKKYLNVYIRTQRNITIDHIYYIPYKEE